MAKANEKEMKVAGIDENEGSEGYKWTKSVTVQLLLLIKANYVRLSTCVKKTAYVEIAKQINDVHNTTLTYEQIDSKWKGLQRTYKKLKKQQTAKGKLKRHWEYYDLMDDILSKAPVRKSPATLSTEEHFVSCNKYQTDNDQEEMSIDPIVFTENSYRTRRLCLTEEELREQRREAARDRRHNERMEATNRFLDLFETMVERM